VATLFFAALKTAARIGGSEQAPGRRLQAASFYIWRGPAMLTETR
jgi:hypothetical protein